MKLYDKTKDRLWLPYAAEARKMDAAELAPGQAKSVQWSVVHSMMTIGCPRESNDTRKDFYIAAGAPSDDSAGFNLEPQPHNKVTLIRP